MGSLIIITTTTGLLIYYTYYRKNKDKIYLRDAETQTQTQTQTQTPEITTPPNEINLPDFITVENNTNLIDTNVIDIIDRQPKRSLSLSSFFNYMRNV